MYPNTFTLCNQHFVENQYPRTNVCPNDGNRSLDVIRGYNVTGFFSKLAQSKLAYLYQVYLRLVELQSIFSKTINISQGSILNKSIG